MKKRRLRCVSVSVFVDLISTDIINRFFYILVYSCREQEYTKIFKNRSIISVDIKSTKTEMQMDTPFFHCEYSIATFR